VGVLGILGDGLVGGEVAVALDREVEAAAGFAISKELLA